MRLTKKHKRRGAVVIIAYIMMMMGLGLVSTGCDSDEPKHKASTQPPVTGSVYQGQVEGCKQHWDELLCGERTVNAGTLDAKKDANGTTIVINLNTSKQDKVWK